MEESCYTWDATAKTEEAIKRSWKNDRGMNENLPEAAD